MLGAVLGGRVRRTLYRLLCGYDIAPDASIGLALIHVAEARIGNGSRIGHFTIIRNLEGLFMEPEARMGTFNWVFGMLPSSLYFTDEPDRRSTLTMEKGASITSRHIVDCTGAVTIGAYATVAGFYSQILTHGIDVATNRQSSRPVLIGRHSLIGTRVVVLKGSRIPDRAVIGAGSVFRGAPEEMGGLWSGVPATRISATDEDAAYFNRTTAHVQ